MLIMTKILAIESSCDETAAAIIDHNKHILAHHISSQIELHQKFGGVVPEIAARQHLHNLQPIIEETLKDANTQIDEIDAIASTTGPGLIGGLLVGTTMAKTIAHTHKLPFIAVNHLEAHALTTRLTNNVPFPYLLLLVSGGHCQLIIAHELGKYEVLGQTKDDAVGEAFDKVAKMLNLPYPGGPSIEKIAKTGNSKAFKLPQPYKNAKHFDFSYSGLKTAVFHMIRKQEQLNDQFKADIAASFQQTVSHSLTNRVERAMQHIEELNLERFVLAGGVAANQTIRADFEKLCHNYGYEFFVPPVNLCTDNAAMIAWTAMEYFLQDPTINHMNINPRPRWALS